MPAIAQVHSAESRSRPRGAEGDGAVWGARRGMAAPGSVALADGNLDRSKPRQPSTRPQPVHAAVQNAPLRLRAQDVRNLERSKSPTDAFRTSAMTPPVRTRARVTLADIANACDLSRATVSLVLRGSPLVNAQTRARVEAELKRQGYVYHRGAANLRRKVSSTVALVINDLSNPFFAEFAAGVDEALAAAGYVTLLGSTGESSERQQAVLTSLLEHDPAGIILSPAEGSDAARLRPLLASRMPMLVFNRTLGDDVPDQRWDYLALDNAHGARLATEHLLAQGHRRIAFFGGHGESS